ncbi:MAG: ATP-binding cassette domain-containing protein, partial [Actinobacteria bacterium]|nr:ATP-binding cassette domain-containing protein [Actinomycetota bacterium]
MSALELAEVAKTYPGPGRGVRALTGVSLRVEAGQTVAITGASGSGKTTLLNLIGTLERPSAGRITIDGVDTTRRSERELADLRAWRLGFVFQQFCLLEHVNMLDNVGMGLLYRGAGPRQRRIRAEQMIDQVGLANRRHHRPAQLSGGERQRVAIARAVIGRP